MSPGTLPQPGILPGRPGGERVRRPVPEGRGGAGGRTLARGDPYRCGGDPRLQALHPERVSRAGPAAHRDAPRLHARPRRFRRRHRHELPGGSGWVPRRLSRASRLRQPLEVLELVPARRPAAGSGRARAHRRHHAPGDGRVSQRCLPGLRGGAICGRRDGGDHGGDVPRPLRGRWRPFRPRSRQRTRPPVGVPGHARRAARGAGGRRPRHPADSLPRGLRSDRPPVQRRSTGRPMGRRCRRRAGAGPRRPRRAAGAGRRAGGPTPAQSTRTHAGRPSWSNGPSTARATPGRGEARTARIPTPPAPMPRGSWCGSSTSTRVGRTDLPPER